MSLHPTMAAYLAPFAPPSSDVHKFAEQAMPGVEVRDATHADFVDSMAGDLELVPTEQDEHTKKLQRAGLVSPPRRRSSDWDGSRAATDNAHRVEVNSTTTDVWGFRV